MDDKKKVSKVVSGTAKTKKKGELRKFADEFVSEDMGNVKSYVFTEIVVPGAKRVLSELVTGFVDMLLYGEVRGGRTESRTSASRVSYRSYYEKNNDRNSSREARSRNIFDYDEIIFKTRGDAEAVLKQLDDIIYKYDVVSVGDLYDMADLSAPHTAHNYGWTDLRNARVISTRDGYIIKLPKALPID